MPGKTPVFALNYPVDTDPLIDWPAISQLQAEAVEAALKGRVNIPNLSTLADEVAARVAADTALGNALRAELGVTAWATVPWVGAPYFTNDPGAGQPPVQYRREGKRVFVRGWGITGASAVAAGSKISNPLPAAFCPPVRTTTWAMRNSGGVAMRVDIDIDGGVFAMEPIAAATYINFATVQWPVG